MAGADTSLSLILSVVGYYAGGQLFPSVLRALTGINLQIGDGVSQALSDSFLSGLVKPAVMGCCLNAVLEAAFGEAATVVAAEARSHGRKREATPAAVDGRGSGLQQMLQLLTTPPACLGMLYIVTTKAAAASVSLGNAGEEVVGAVAVLYVNAYACGYFIAKASCLARCAPVFAGGRVAA